MILRFKFSIIQALERAAGLLALAMVFATALIFPLRISDRMLPRIESWFPGPFLGELFQEQLRPFLMFHHSPMVMKESLLLALGSLALAAYALSRSLHRESLANQKDSFWPAKWWERPGIWICLLLTVALLRLPWLPTPYYGLRTLLLMGISFGVAGAIAESPQARPVWNRLPALILFCGLVLATVSILQHLGRVDGWLPNQLAEPRNRMGSLIGHNTGLSGWLMFPLSIAAWGILTGRGPWRMACWLFIVLGLFVVISAQSRSVWLAIAIAGPLGTVFMVRALGLASRRKVLFGSLGLLLMAITATTAFPTVNPLARQVTPLVDRVRQDILDLNQLRRETRYRVLFASLPLMAQAPLLGHGIGQFQWVYPPAQGKFLHTYLFETEAYTSKRTDIAHNDWLQLVIEFGIVGLLITLGVLTLLFRRISLIWAALPNGREKALLVAMLTPVFGLMIQGLVDFPFHLAPHGWLATLIVFLAASPRSYGLQMKTSPLPRREIPTDRISSSSSPSDVVTATGPVTWGFRPQYAIFLTITVGCLLLVPLAMRVASAEWSADALFQGGNSLATTARLVSSRDQDLRIRILERARHLYRRVSRAHQFHGPAYEGHALALLNLATIYQGRAMQAASNGDKSGFQLASHQARSFTEAAIQQMNLGITLGELRWHYSYLTIARLYSLLWRLKPDLSDSLQVNYARSAATAFEASFGLNPTDAELLAERAQFVEQPVIGQKDLALELRNLLWRVDPRHADFVFIEPARQTAILGLYPQAHDSMKRLKAEFPSQWRIWAAHSEIRLMEALAPTTEVTTDSLTPERYHQLLDLAWAELDGAESLAGEPQPEIARWRMEVSAARRDWNRILAEAPLARRNRFNLNEVRILERITRRFMEQGPEGIARTPREFGINSDLSKIFQRYRMMYFDQPVPAFQNLLENVDAVSELTPFEAAYSIRLLLALDQQGIAGVFAQAALRNPYLQPALAEYFRTLASQANREIRPSPEGFPPNSLPPAPIWPLP